MTSRRASSARRRWTFDDVLPEGVRVAARRTANVHTGGTIDDVTAELHPHLAAVAVLAAAAIDISVVGIDLMVTSPSEPDYVIIEANEQPGLAESRAPAHRRTLSRPALPAEVIDGPGDASYGEVYSVGSKMQPGLRMPAGSNATLIRRCNANLAGSSSAS